ncbi:MFS general substrate transporter [Saccharata proteae CBS 121410]|uniref:MFS general substrate transporter n=1 Tax=Saccharata proteae CBS 121410 TaxID=1314787 RepID=A0A9P4HRS3_9PEZI|nr:MFS general substrate transporter [Saccharata proteae CBS 121410]
MEKLGVVEPIVRGEGVFLEGGPHDGSRELGVQVTGNDPEDPLNWSMWLKISIVVQASLLAALGTLNTAIINPAYVPLAEEFGISTVQASYQTTVVIALNGVGPFLWLPLANVYGRRLVYLFSTLLGVASALGSAYAESYAQLIVARVFNGVFPAAMSLGAATVVDLFFVHQRGRAMGLFTVMLTNGAHVAPIVGGLLGQYCGWRWTFKFAAILDGVMLLIIALFMPETLYTRGPAAVTATQPSPAPESPHTSKNTYLSRLNPISAHPDRHLHPSQIILPSLQMARHPSVLFPALYYGMQYGFASILPAVTVAPIFTSFFHWDTLTIGLAYGAALTIGGCIGELLSGPVLDHHLKRRQQKQRQRGSTGTASIPEDRLSAIWTGALLVPTGLLLYGFTLQYHTHFILPLIGMAVSAAGIQALTTVCYTYSVESVADRSRSQDVAQVFNFVRQEFGMTFAFYAVRLGDEIGFQWEFLLFAGVGSVVGFAPVGWLMWRGRGRRKELVREREGEGMSER